MATANLTKKMRWGETQTTFVIVVKATPNIAKASQGKAPTKLTKVLEIFRVLW